MFFGDLSQCVPVTQPGAVSQSLFSLRQVRRLCFRGGKGCWWGGGGGVNVLATVTGCAHHTAWCHVSGSLLSAVVVVVVELMLNVLRCHLTH